MEKGVAKLQRFLRRRHPMLQRVLVVLIFGILASVELVEPDHTRGVRNAAVAVVIVLSAAVVTLSLSSRGRSS
jgi:hypothetical protein